MRCKQEIRVGRMQKDCGGIAKRMKTVWFCVDNREE